MHIVEIRRRGRDLAAAMTEMRIWLDHHRKQPDLFEVVFLPSRDTSAEPASLSEADRQVLEFIRNRRLGKPEDDTHE